MLHVPISIIAAADENSPVYGLDDVSLDFIRLGKKNLTYDRVWAVVITLTVR